MNAAAWERWKLALFSPLQDEVDLPTSVLRVEMVKAYREYVEDLPPTEKIGPELFVRIASHPSVRLHSKRCRLDPSQRSWIRDYVMNDVYHIYISAGFWWEDGLAQATVEDLLCSAKDSTAPAERRVVAIRTLIRLSLIHI